MGDQQVQKLPRLYQRPDLRRGKAQNTVLALKIMVLNNGCFFLFHIGAGFYGFHQTTSNAFSSDIKKNETLYREGEGRHSTFWPAIKQA